MKRCWWPGEDETYQHYHDHEWGFPVDDDNRLFEKICLEGFQSGLSWLTVLRKRDNFRKVFTGFDFEKIALYKDADVERLVQDTGIIRHRGKINSTINNAKRAIELKQEFGTLAAYFWSYEPSESEHPEKITKENIPAKTEFSTALSKDLKKRGWSFVGPTTCYAFMQAMGLVNDHVESCDVREQVKEARKNFQKPLPRRT